MVAAVLNLTVTGRPASATGRVAPFERRPEVSNINVDELQSLSGPFSASQPGDGAVGADGVMDIYASGGGHAIVDLLVLHRR